MEGALRDAGRRLAAAEARLGAVGEEAQRRRTADVAVSGELSAERDAARQLRLQVGLAFCTRRGFEPGWWLLVFFGCLLDAWTACGRPRWNAGVACSTCIRVVYHMQKQNIQRPGRT